VKILLAGSGVVLTKAGLFYAPLVLVDQGNTLLLDTLLASVARLFGIRVSLLGYRGAPDNDAESDQEGYRMSVGASQHQHANASFKQHSGQQSAGGNRRTEPAKNQADQFDIAP